MNNDSNADNNDSRETVSQAYLAQLRTANTQWPHDVGPSIRDWQNVSTDDWRAQGRPHYWTCVAQCNGISVLYDTGHGMYAVFADDVLVNIECRLCKPMEHKGVQYFLVDRTYYNTPYFIYQMPTDMWQTEA